MDILNFLVQQVLLSILLPAVATGVLYLLLKPKLGEWTAALAMVIAYLIGFIAISTTGSLNFPPKTVQQWLPYAALGGLCYGLLEVRWLKAWWLHWPFRLVLLQLLLWRLFQAQINHPFPNLAWSSADIWRNFTLITLFFALFWLAIDLIQVQQSRREVTDRHSAVLPTALMLIAAGSALCIVLAHSVVMGQLSGVVAAILGAIALLCWLLKGWRLAPQATAPLVLLLALPWLSLFTTLPWLVVFLLALSPWLLLLGFKNLRLWQQTALQLLLVSLPVGLALVLAAQQS